MRGKRLHPEVMMAATGCYQAAMSAETGTRGAKVVSIIARDSAWRVYVEKLSQLEPTRHPEAAAFNAAIWRANQARNGGVKAAVVLCAEASEGVPTSASSGGKTTVAVAVACGARSKNASTCSATQTTPPVKKKRVPLKSRTVNAFGF